MVKLYGVVLMKPIKIVMECMEKGSLNNFLQKELKEHALATTDPQWPLRIRLALDIARGVDAIHSHSPPIIHRDIKSHNILVVSLPQQCFLLTVLCSSIQGGGRKLLI